MRPCKHADIEADKAGRVTMRKDRGYTCRVPIPDLSKILPASVTQEYGYHAPRPNRNTFKHWCEKCPLYEEREKPE